MKIYRIEIYGSCDSCTEFWEYFPLTDFYLNKNKAEMIFEKIKGLKSIEIEEEIGAYVGGNRPELQEYELIE